MLQRFFYAALERAKRGKVVRLNAVFRSILPFNVPHGIRVRSFSEREVRVALPDKRANRNHLKGMHACAIATACEFCSGLAVLAQFEMQSYRLIMHRLEVDYTRRPAKGTCEARAVIPEGFKDEVLGLIEASADGAARFVMPSTLYDMQGEAVAHAVVHWHVKAWNAVKYQPTA